MDGTNDRTEEAILQLRRARPKDSFEFLDPKALARDIAKKGEQALPDILKEMRYSNARQRRVLIAALGQIGSPRAIPMLLRSTRDCNAQNRALASGILFKFSPRDRRDLWRLHDALSLAGKGEVRALGALYTKWDEQINGKKSRLPRRMRGRHAPSVPQTGCNSGARAAL